MPQKKTKKSEAKKASPAKKGGTAKARKPPTQEQCQKTFERAIKRGSKNAAKVVHEMDKDAKQILKEDEAKKPAAKKAAAKKPAAKKAAAKKPAAKPLNPAAAWPFPTGNRP